jgi:hypothetical protein
MITYTWNILKLTAHKQLDSQQNVIYQVDWEYIASDGETSDKITGSTSMDVEITDNFIQYEQLTREIVGSWLESKIGEEEMQQKKQILSDSIGYLKNIVELTLPEV